MKNAIVMPALAGGLLVGIASAIPLVNLLNCLCCAWVVAGGYLAGYLYLRSVPPGSRIVTYGDAVVLGLVTGVFGTIVWAVMEIPLTFFQLGFQLGTAQLEQIRRGLEEAQLPQQLQDALLQYLGSAELTLAMMVFGLLINLVVSVAFCIVGSLLSFIVIGKPEEMLGSTAAGTPPAPPTPSSTDSVFPPPFDNR